MPDDRTQTTDTPKTTAPCAYSFMHRAAYVGGCWDWSCRVCHEPLPFKSRTTHGSRELDDDAAKLEAMGADSGATLGDILNGRCWRCFGLGKLVVSDPDPAAPIKFIDCTECSGTGNEPS